MITNDKSFVDESPLIHHEGTTKAYVIKVTLSDGSAPTITTTNGTTQIFKNGSGSNLSATLFSGSASASGNSYTTPAITGLSGGNRYVCVYYATINGSVDLVGKIELICPRDKDMM